MFYSPSKNAFYDSPENYKDFPIDCVGISDEDYRDLVNFRPIGKVVAPGPNGFPVLVDGPKASKEDLAKAARAERNRLLREVYDIAIIRLGRESRHGVDSTLGIEAMDNYAKLLLDLPSQEGFPEEINWPVIPDA